MNAEDAAGVRHLEAAPYGDERLPARFWGKVIVHDDGCWRWDAKLDRWGYGHFAVLGRKLKCHRVAYSSLVGPIPPDAEIDHVCHSIDQACAGGPSCPHRSCVNPAHLEPVTHAENARRSTAAQKTHCKNGHEFTPENTYDIRHLPAGGARACRACNAAAAKRYKMRREAA